MVTMTRFTVVLRRSVRGEHEHLEGRLGLPASIGDWADYSRLLTLWATVWDAVALLASPATAPGSELSVLASDARTALALDRSELVPCPPPGPAPFDLAPDEASVWGAVYVLRGSSLGNQVLHPLILGQLDGRHGSAFRYLTGRGSDVRRDWSAFCRRLDGWAARGTDTDRDRTIASAATTFHFVGTVADATGWVAQAAPHERVPRLKVSRWTSDGLL